MSSELPIVYLAFANSLDDHLATLKDESREIFNLLEPLEKQDRISIRREESSEFDELYQDLLAYDDRIVIFHYGGHADGETLELEGGGGSAGGIAGLLGQQSSLKLVFLNGCATRAQVKLLQAAGVPAVIATSVKINDNRATQFATAFYAALVGGNSIFEAFDSASNYIEGKFGIDGSDSTNSSQNLAFDHQEEETDSGAFEWALHVQEHATADLQQWRLSEAREDWRVELSDSQGKLKSLDGEPLVLEHHSRRRTLTIVHCQRCDTKTAIPEDNNVACPVCGFAELEAGTAISNVPDLLVPFHIEESDALAIFKKSFGDEGFSEPRLKKVLLPYWHFEVETRTALEAERGSVDLSSSDSPTLKWEKIEDEFDLSTPGFLVPGGQAPPANTGNSADWQWELGETKKISDLDLPDALVPAVEDLPTAFESFTEDLSIRLEQEVRERVGGLEQKNISTDTRYKHLAAKSLLLPHWYITADTPDGEICLLIHGQTGAVRYPQIPGMNAGLSESQRTMQKSASDARAGHEKSSALVSVFSGVGIGIMVGLLMGLAAPSGAGAKTVVSVFIGAVGVGLAALLGLNDRYFSGAKGLRIGSFGLAVAISAMSGIYVRDHQLLVPEHMRPLSLIEKKAQYEALGFDEPQVKNLLAQQITASIELAKKQASGASTSRAPGALHATETHLTTCNELNNGAYKEMEPGGVLNAFNNWTATNEEDKNKWHPLFDDMASFSLEDKKRILLIARDAACGYQDFDGKPVLPKESQCQANNDSGYPINGMEDERQLLINRLSELTDGGDQALPILGNFLCR